MAEFRIAASRRGFTTLVAIVAVIWLVIAIAIGIMGNWVFDVVWLILGLLLAAALIYIYRASVSRWS
jgi:uncharacterized membrane protein